MQKILVVDDEKSIRRMLDLFFTKEGYQVTTARNVVKALKYFDENDFDLVITDIMLGKETGVELLKILSKKSHVPVIMITGKPNLDTATESLRLGAFDYIGKPIKMDDMARLTKKAIQYKTLKDREEQLENENEKYRFHLEELVKKRTVELESTNVKLQQEIEEHKKAREILLQYEMIVSASKDMMSIVGRDYKYMAVNETYLKACGQPRSEIIGCTPADMVGKETFSTKIKPRLDRCFEGEDINYQEWFNYAVWGRNYCDISYYPYYEEDNYISGVVINIRNITEQKKAKEAIMIKDQQLVQADKLSSLGVLLAGLADEINNPNNIVTMNVDMLLNFYHETLPILEQHYKTNGDFTITGMSFTKIREHIPQLLDQTVENSNRIKRIIRKLHDFSSSDDADLTKVLDINTVVNSAVNMSSNRVKEATHTLEVRYFPDIILVKGNMKSLEQVFIHVIINAAEALTEVSQGIYITISKDRTSNCVSIEIRDEGRGVSEEQLKQLYNPFFTTKQEKGSTGLGLSVARDIIKKHGGKMNFESSQGKGTTCKIFLPLE